MLPAASLFQKDDVERGLTSQIWALLKNSQITLSHFSPVEEGVRRPEDENAESSINPTATAQEWERSIPFQKPEEGLGFIDFN